LCADIASKDVFCQIFLFIALYSCHVQIANKQYKNITRKNPMSNEKENSWLENFKREAGIRRGIILSGDILDVFHDNNSKRYVSIQSLITASLQNKGFKTIILWDKFQGVHDDAKNQWNELRQKTVTENSSSACSDYDMGETNVTQPNITTPPDLNDFLSVVLFHLTHQTDERIAFILDWSQYLFGNAHSLSEEERQSLLILTKAICTNPSFSSVDLDKPSNLLVLLTVKSGAIPPIFGQGNTAIKEIVVPQIGRVEREGFIKRELSKWNLRKTPQPGQPQFNDFIDLTDSLSIRELQHLIKLSRQQNTPLSFEQLINLYRYGEQKSPWEDLNKNKLRNVNETLQKRVKGQDEAVAKVVQVVKRAYIGLSGLQHSKKQRMPKGTLFFVGPTGVGKTELAKSLAQFLFGDEEACIRFDMSEFNHEHSDQRLVGAPPGYVGYEEGGQLTNAVKKRPFSVLLFDEIEKAHSRILDKFLQILEDGRLTDGKGETVSFAETVIIFTSNIGASEIELHEDKKYVKEQFLKKVQEHFAHELGRPELLNRIGNNIVPFNFITNDDFLLAIAKTKLNPLREKLKEKYGIIDVVFKDETKALMSVCNLVDKKNGGRGVNTVIEQMLLDPLTDFLFEEETDSEMYAGKQIRILQIGNEAKFEFEFI
jgi:DNA polymerase III delta prime subunit